MKKTVIKSLMITAAAMTMTACSKKPAEDGNAMMADNEAMMDNGAMADGAMAGSEMPMVGGAPMDPANDVVTNASKAGNLKTLVAAVGAAGLVDTLKGTGPFTVFAPNDDAFKKLPAGTVETLLKPENKQKLAGILTYHVVSGKLDTAELDKEIAAGGGKADAGRPQRRSERARRQKRRGGSVGRGRAVDAGASERQRGHASIVRRGAAVATPIGVAAAPRYLPVVRAISGAAWPRPAYEPWAW